MMSETNIDIRTDESNADYHADTECDSNSRLSTFIESPQKFEGIYVTREHPAEETPAMRQGTRVHSLVLEPDKVQGQYFLIDSSTRTTKKWKEGVVEANHRGLIPATEKEMMESEAIAEAVLRHSLAIRLFDYCSGGIREQSIRWTDNGVRKKARLDLFCKDAPTLGPVIIDLKTSGDPSPGKFKWSIKDYGYDRQAAWYIDAAIAAYGVIPTFLFLVVGSKYPYDVYCYKRPTERIEIARKYNAEAVKQLQAARESGIYRRVYSDLFKTQDEDQIITLD